MGLPTRARVTAKAVIVPFLAGAVLGAPLFLGAMGCAIEGDGVPLVGLFAPLRAVRFVAPMPPPWIITLFVPLGFGLYAFYGLAIALGRAYGRGPMLFAALCLFHWLFVVSGICMVSPEAGSELTALQRHLPAVTVWAACFIGLHVLGCVFACSARPGRSPAVWALVITVFLLGVLGLVVLCFPH